MMTSRSAGGASATGSNQQFTIKVFHDGDMKKFTLSNLPLRFQDLDQTTKQKAWSQELPGQFNYYHVEDDLVITIDDQESFEGAVLHNINELNSHIMRLYIAENQGAAHKLIQRHENMSMLRLSHQVPEPVPVVPE